MSVAFDLLRVAATCASVLLYLSPYPDFRRIHVQRATGEVRLLPVVALFCSASMWCVYGLVADSIFPLVVVNTFGALTSLGFSAVYYVWSSPAQRVEVRKLWGYALLVTLTATSYAVLGVHGFTGQTTAEVAGMLGLVCVTANISAFASPLATMGQVVRTQSAASLPITLCAVNLVSGLLWSTMAVGQRDMFVLTPNALGSVLSALQVALYIKYRPLSQPQTEIVYPENVLEEGRVRAMSVPMAIATGPAKLKQMAMSFTPRGNEFRPSRLMLSPLVTPGRAEASPLLAGSFPSSPFAGSYGARPVTVAA